MPHESTNMPDQIICRVRPLRLVVLLSANADKKEFMLAVDFLSRLWGGRFSPILLVSRKGDNSSVKVALGSWRPEIVVGVGLDHPKWSAISDEVCQPRKYVVLDTNAIQDVSRTNVLGFATAYSVVRAIRREHPDLKRPNLVLWRIEARSRLAPVFAAAFGLVPDNKTAALAKYLNAKESILERNSDAASFLRACSDMARKCTWLELASSGLQTYTWRPPDITASGPTIVVVDDKTMIPDAVLFWNLRNARSDWLVGPVTAFPASAINSKSAVLALADWLRSTGLDSNFCSLVSRRVSRTRLEKLVARMRPHLKGLPQHHVDIVAEPGAPSIVIPFERSQQVRTLATGSMLAFDVPLPWCEKGMPDRETWICDLMKDTQNGRAPCELILPPVPAAQQIINAPSPQDFRMSMLSDWGQGPDCLNVACDKSRESVRLIVPAEQELLEGILESYHVVVRKDEKRIRYLQAIDMLGGLLRAAKAFVGIPLKILEAFLPERKERSESRVDPLTFDQIRHRARLGGKKEAKENWHEEAIEKYVPAHAKKVARRRFAAHLAGELGISSTDIQIINRLVERGVLRRKWRLNQCGSCERSYWVDEINLGSPTLCPGCRKQIPLGDKVILGYELNELIALAINEGIIAVVLTGRFLYNLTSKGFMWLPGVKCSADGLTGDLDIFASCDGELVAAECKCRTIYPTEPKARRELCEQVVGSVQLAKKAGVRIFVIAARWENFPERFCKEVRRAAGNDMAVNFLDRRDLETGRRSIPWGKKNDRYISIHDFLPPIRREKKATPKKPRKRYVDFGLVRVGTAEALRGRP